MRAMFRAMALRGSGCGAGRRDADHDRNTSRPSRPSVPHPIQAMHIEPKPARPHLRVVSTAWGESYVREFLDFCLPALLAPGNLPALAEHFDVEFVFLTEREQFGPIASSPIHARALQHCRFRLVALDDLVATRGSYGMSLTYALHRGIADLGPAMTETYALFVNADFILADGSYRGLLPHLLRGERLILAPSYCTIAEEVRPLLRAALSSDHAVLSLPPRQLADIVIRHRHFTVRGKTVNQRFFHLRYIEQYYWMVDECTMLAHQLPIAVVAMKPERYLEEPACLWDYGIIREFCPSMRHTVLGDSDDFLMLELRGRDTAKDDLLPGWPEPVEIARVLATFITDYKRDIGRARLTVHSRDLTPAAAAAHEALDAFVASVYAHLPETLLHHLGHPQWTYHLPFFHEARRRHLEAHEAATLEAAGDAPAGEASVPEAAARSRLAGGLPAESGLTAQCAALATAAGQSPSPDTARAVGEVVARLTRHVLQAARFEAAAASMQQWHRARTTTTDDGDARRDREDLSRTLDTAAHAARDSLAACDSAIREFIASENLRLSATVRRMQDLVEAAMTLDRSMPKTIAPRSSPRGRGLLQTLSRVVFGAAPRYHPWHWLAACTRLAMDAARAEARPGRAILLAGTGFGETWHLDLSGATIHSVPVALAREAAVLSVRAASIATCDACIIEADIAELKHFRAMYEALRPSLREGARVIALFLNAGGATVPLQDPDFLRNAFPACGPARIAYSGSRAGAAAFRTRAAVERALVRRGIPGGAAIALAMAAAAPMALAASRRESGRTLDNSTTPADPITAVTIECIAG